MNLGKQHLFGKLAVGSALIAGLTLTGCTQLQHLVAPQPAATSKEEVQADAKLVPGGSADENRAFFLKTAADYSKGKSPVAGKEIVDYFAAQGFDKAKMQVSFDKTPVGYDADSIFVSVLFDKQCLVAQFETADRSYQIDEVAGVGADGTQCLIGKTRNIDW